MKRRCKDPTDYSPKSSSRHAKHCKWSDAEDQLLLKMAGASPGINWNEVAEALKEITPPEQPFKTARQCRERWNNRINPSIKVTPWTGEEEQRFFELHQRLGSKWSEIALELPGRTDNTIKNLFFCKLRKIARRINKGIVSADIKGTDKDIEHTLYLINHLKSNYLSTQTKEQGDKYILEMVKKGLLTKHKLEKYLKEFVSAVKFANLSLEKSTESDESSGKIALPSINAFGLGETTRKDSDTSSKNLEGPCLAELIEWQRLYPYKVFVTLPLPNLSTVQASHGVKDTFQPTLFHQRESTAGDFLPYFLMLTALDLLNKNTSY